MTENNSRSFLSIVHHLLCHLKILSVEAATATPGYHPRVSTRGLSRETGYDSITIHRGLRKLRNTGCLAYEAPRGRDASKRTFPVQIKDFTPPPDYPIGFMPPGPGAEWMRPQHQPSVRPAPEAAPRHAPGRAAPQNDRLAAPGDLSRYKEMTWDQFLCEARQANKGRMTMHDQAKWDLFCERYQPADLLPEIVHGVHAQQIKCLRLLIVRRMEMTGDREFCLSSGRKILVPPPLPPKHTPISARIEEPVTPVISPEEQEQAAQAAIARLQALRNQKNRSNTTQSNKPVAINTPDASPETSAKMELTDDQPRANTPPTKQTSSSTKPHATPQHRGGDGRVGGHPDLPKVAGEDTTSTTRDVPRTPWRDIVGNLFAPRKATAD